MNVPIILAQVNESNGTAETLGCPTHLLTIVSWENRSPSCTLTKQNAFSVVWILRFASVFFVIQIPQVTHWEMNQLKIKNFCEIQN